MFNGHDMVANRASISHIKILCRGCFDSYSWKQSYKKGTFGTNGAASKSQQMAGDIMHGRSLFLPRKGLKKAFWAIHFETSGNTITSKNVFAHSTVLTTRKPNVPSQRSSCPNFEKIENFSGRTVRYLQCCAWMASTHFEQMKFLRLASIYGCNYRSIGVWWRNIQCTPVILSLNSVPPVMVSSKVLGQCVCQWSGMTVATL